MEKNLVEWGKLLHAAAMPAEYVANVIQAWARIDDHAGRRFSVHVDRSLEAGAGDDGNTSEFSLAAAVADAAFADI